MEQDYRRQMSVSSNSGSISSLSSGFESMLGSPTASDNDMLSILQELKQRMESMERKVDYGMPVPPMSSTPNTRHDRQRCDSASSTGSTVIGSAHELQMGSMDIGSHSDVFFDEPQSDSKLLVENTLKLTSENVDVMSKYENVVIKFAVFGEKKRIPENCSNNGRNGDGQVDAKMFAELMAKLEDNEKRIKALQSENEQLKGRKPDIKVTEPSEDESSSILELSTETSEAEIQEIKSSEEEENKRFIIRSVLDPKSNQEISLDDALLQGIVNLEKGKYFNTETGESMLIPQAMEKKMINVVSKITNRTPRRRSSTGILTLTKNILPKGTLLIKSMKNTKTGEMVPPEEALKLGITTKSLGVYRDITMQKDYDIVDAVEQGFVLLEDQNVGQTAEKVHCVYEISGVVDKKTGKTLNYHDAVLNGLIIKDLGVCKDTVNGKYMYVGYAIMSGMMKVDVIKEHI